MATGKQGDTPKAGSHRRVRRAFCWAAAFATTCLDAGATLAVSDADRAADRFWAQFHSIMPLVAGGAAAVAILLVGLWAAARRKRRKEAAATDDAAVDASKTAGQDVSYPELRSPVSKEETIEMDAGNTRPYVANGHDYTEDVSRYTQQPGPEVNDVSRFTHGVGLDDEDDFQSLQNSRSTPPVSRPSVGSRVERRRSAKKRKRR